VNLQVQFAASDEADSGRGDEFAQVDAAHERRGCSAQPRGGVPPRRLCSVRLAGAVLQQSQMSHSCLVILVSTFQAPGFHYLFNFPSHISIAQV
jgi:hypothetical protein